LRLGVLGLALALATVGHAASPAPEKRLGPTRSVDQKRSLDQFVAQAAGRSLAGVELSDLALQRSESAAVRRLARRAHDEHANTFDTLLGLATGAGGTAAPPETIDLEQRGIKSRLAALSGRAFDRAYVDALRTNDDRDIALYRSYAHDGSDAAFKQWVEEQLTTIRKRRQLIDAAALEIR
jgi:putative membrane protein